MDHALIRLLTRAARAGAELTTNDNQVHIRGLNDPELLAELRTHRDAIRTLLTSDTCAACNTPHWIHEHVTGIPWCRPHANQRGTQLLRHEAPHLLEP